MKRHSQTSILLLVFLLLAACFRHQNETMDEKQDRGDRKAEVTGADNESAKASQPETTKEQPSGTGAGKYGLPGYTFVVPDKWEVVPPERFLNVPDRWEVIPVPSIHLLYMVHADQNHTKARFCFQTILDDKKYLETKPFEHIQEKQLEQVITKRFQVNDVNLIERKDVKMNGFDVLKLHFTYSKSLEEGDIMMAFLYKDGNYLSIFGTFASPMYTELQKDITAVMESIRKE